MKRGFTLVELSIVLVIIGLLIGGILAARSMIETAKINKVIRQISQWDTAISNFRTKYNQIPGDSDLFSNPGNNNGAIGGASEFEYTWQHLSEGVSLKNGKNNSFDASGVRGDVDEGYCPRYYLQTGESATHCILIISEPGRFSDNKLRYRDASAQWATNKGGLIRTADIFALDTKLDDGFPRSGAVRNYITWSSTDCETGTNPNYSYNVASEGFLCSMFIEVNVTNGGGGGIM